MSSRLHIPFRVVLAGALCACAVFAEDHYIVKINGDVDAVAQSYGLRVVRSLAGSAAGYHVLASQGVTRQSVVQALAAEPAVSSVEVDKAVRLPGIKAASPLNPDASSAAAAANFSSTPMRYFGSMASSAYVQQPATTVINLKQAQGISTGRGTVVATIDTGVDFSHPVLAKRLAPGWDFVHETAVGQEQADVNQETTPILDQETTPILDQETTPILDGGTAIILQQETTPILDQETTPILDGKQFPAYGHGTMVAGLIHLVAPRATIMPLRAFGADGSAKVSQIVEALYYGVDNGANVINMSFSLKHDSPTLDLALDYAAANGVVCVASAGNDGQAMQVWPAAYGSVIDVAATDNFMVRATFSNYGAPPVALAAPGVGVITTYPAGHYAQVWGTSFSAPIVAGAAALLLGQNAGDGGNGVPVAAALAQATPIGQELGAGELDLYQALRATRRDN